MRRRKLKLIGIPRCCWQPIPLPTSPIQGPQSTKSEAKREHKPKPMDGYKLILVFLLAWTPRSTVLGWTKSLMPRSLSVCSLSIPHWPLYKYSSISRYTDMRIRPLKPYRQSHCHCYYMPRPANSFLLVLCYQRKSPLIGQPCLAGASSYIPSQAI